MDGTPLGAHGEPPAAPHVLDESAVTKVSGAPHSAGAAGAGGGSGAAGAASEGAGIPPSQGGREEFHLTFIQDEGLTRRLVKELKAVGHGAELTWPEFKRDPVGFTKRSGKAYGTAAWKFFSQPNVALATLAAFIFTFG
ncbi:MAG TPA: hypothetical protein VF621_06095, partial [Pyrinomonadaceae bacterium]